MNYGLSPSRLLVATAIGLSATALCGQAQAAGVAAGTLISNMATASYDVGGNPEQVSSNTVTIAVDELLDVAVASLDAANVPLSAGGAALTFEITNTGNGPEAFAVEADPALSGDDFDPAVTALAYDSNGNGSYDAGTDTVITAGANTPLIAAGGSLKVFVVTAPGTTPPADAALANVRLTARAATGTGTPGTLFAGQGTGGVDAVVGTSTAQGNAQGRLIARSATVSLVKSATIADPFGGAEPVPGAVVTYTLVASVGGSGSVANFTVTDAIPAGTSYRPATLRLDSSPLTDAAGDDAGQASAAGVAVSMGTVTGGSSHTITFSVNVQ